MRFGQMHYLPVGFPYFSILAGLLAVLILVVQLRALRFAYMRLGLSPTGALLLLIASLVGSYFNIPIVTLPEKLVQSGRLVSSFGIEYVIPTVVDWPGTIVAVNVGGALIPGLMSLYLIVQKRIYLPAALAITCVAAVCFSVARPVPGLGIALPTLVPAIAATIAALVISRREAAALAYVCGSLGTLIGADLLNLGRVQGLGAPIVSIGGAGTFDGIFVTGVLAVLLASLVGAPEPREPPHATRPASGR